MRAASHAALQGLRFRFSAETPQNSVAFAVPACVSTARAPFRGRDLCLNTQGFYDFFLLYMYLYIQTCLSKGSGAAGYAVREQDPPTSARHFLSPSPKDVGAQGPFAQQLPLERHRQHFVRRKEGFKASATQPLTRRGISKPRGATPWPKPGLVHVEPLPVPSQHGLGERLKSLRRGEVTSASLLFL